MAPYSCGGALKFAAASPTDGTVISCQGRCASIAGAKSGKRNIVRKDFIGNFRFGSESFELYCSWTVWRQPRTGDPGQSHERQFDVRKRVWGRPEGCWTVSTIRIPLVPD